MSGNVMRAAVVALLLSLGLLYSPSVRAADVKAVHVIVALADNEHQGIVPVPAALGDGDDPGRNLYWGALYGVKTFLTKDDGWKMLDKVPQPGGDILERAVFIHGGDTYIIADAYRGSSIKAAIADLFEYSAGRRKVNIELSVEDKRVAVPAGGAADLVAYIGHNGLMDFSLSYPEESGPGDGPEVVILACKSREYFLDRIRSVGARPLLFTNGFMAPEAYTLVAALDGWMKGESKDSIRDRAARAYDRYQKCGIGAARRLFWTGG